MLDSCEDCPYSQKRLNPFYIFCTMADNKAIAKDSIGEIPEWCPLEDFHD